MRRTGELLASQPGVSLTLNPGYRSKPSQNLIIALRVIVTLLVTPTQLPLAR